MLYILLSLLGEKWMDPVYMFEGFVRGLASIHRKNIPPNPGLRNKDPNSIQN